MNQKNIDLRLIDITLFKQPLRKSSHLSIQCQLTQIVQAKLQCLQGLELDVNKFSRRLTTLYMENNRLEGNIPADLGKYTSLVVLNLTSAVSASVSRSHKLCGGQPIFDLPARSKHRNPSSTKKIGSGAIVARTVSLLVLLLCSFAAY